MSRADTLKVWEDMTRELWPHMPETKLESEGVGHSYAKALNHLVTSFAALGLHNCEVVVAVPTRALAQCHSETLANMRYGAAPSAYERSGDVVFQGPFGITIRLVGLHPEPILRRNDRL